MSSEISFLDNSSREDNEIFDHIKNEIYKSVDNVIETYRGNTEFMKKLLDIYKYKIPVFIHKQKKIIDDREMLYTDIKETANIIIQQHCRNKYIYSYDINSFYEISETNDSLNIINSDIIYLRIKEQIPQNLNTHKHQIFKIVKKYLKSQHLLTWKPDENVINKMIFMVNKLFADQDVTLYFMSMIGSIIAGNEGDWFNHDYVHIWHGDGSQQFIKFIEELLYQRTFYTKCNTNVLHTIKTSYSSSSKIPLEKIWYIHINDINRKRTLKLLNSNQELFWISCYHVSLCYPCSYWAEQPLIKNLQEFKEPIGVFYRYIEQCVTCLQFDENEIQHLLVYDEIRDDFKDFLKDNGYPENIVKNDELKQAIVKEFKQINIGNMIFYAGKLKINTSYSLFVKFCNENVETFEQQTAFDDREDDMIIGSFTDSIATTEENVAIQSMYFYNMYKQWHSRYCRKDQMQIFRCIENYMKHLFGKYHTKNGWNLRIKEITEKNENLMMLSDEKDYSDESMSDIADISDNYVNEFDIKKLIINELGILS